MLPLSYVKHHTAQTLIQGKAKGKTSSWNELGLQGPSLILIPIFFSAYHLVMSWPLIDGKNTGEDKASGLWTQIIVKWRRRSTAWATHTHSLKHLHTNSYAYKESFEHQKSQLPWAIDTKMSPVHEVTKNVLIVVESLQPWMLEWTGDADGKLYQLWLTNRFLSLRLKARAVNWFTAESKSKSWLFLIKGLLFSLTG